MGGTTYPGDLAHERHDVGRRNRLGKAELALGDSLDEVFGADKSGTGCARLLGLFTPCKNGDAHVLSSPKWELRDAAHVLSCLSWVDS